MRYGPRPRTTPRYESTAFSSMRLQAHTIRSNTTISAAQAKQSRTVLDSAIDSLVCILPLRVTALLIRLAVHNPGLIAPSLLTSPTFLQQSYVNLSDITVIFEETFANWLDRPTFDALQAQRIRRSKLAVILHSLPDLSLRVLDFVVEQVQDAADWVFLSDITVKDEYYHSFSGIFQNLVKSVDGGAEQKRLGWRRDTYFMGHRRQHT